MSDLSRRAILRTLPAAAAVTAVPAVAIAATIPAADLDIINLAARIVVLAKESDIAVCDRADREEAAYDEYPMRPQLLAKGQPDRRDGESVERLQAWLDDLKPTDVVYREVSRRLANMKAWAAECAAIDEKHGLPAAHAHCDRVNDLLLEDLVPALTDMTPATMKGLGAKADALASLESWGVVEATMEALMRSIIADVRRLAGGANV